MELLESDDPKSELLKKSLQHKKDLQNEVAHISDRTQKALINALVIGGSLTLTYLLVRQFSGSKKKKVKLKQQQVRLIQAADEQPVAIEKVSAAPGIFSQVGSALVSQASVFLLALAKEKLLEYLQSLAEKKADERS